MGIDTFPVWAARQVCKPQKQESRRRKGWGNRDGLRITESRAVEQCGSPKHEQTAAEVWQVALIRGVPALPEESGRCALAPGAMHVATNACGEHSRPQGHHKRAEIPYDGVLLMIQMIDGAKPEGAVHVRPG